MRGWRYEDTWIDNCVGKWGSGGVGNEGREEMMKDNWTDRLSEYVDGTLGVGERAALEAHLAGCVPCAATLEELRRVVARARALDDRPPAADLWPKIAAGVGPPVTAPGAAAHPADAAAQRTPYRSPQRDPA